MNKLIIENRTDMSDLDALLYVKAVVEQGRISNNDKQYSYLTTFKDGVVVATDLNKKSDRFVIYREIT